MPKEVKLLARNIYQEMRRTIISIPNQQHFICAYKSTIIIFYPSKCLEGWGEERHEVSQQCCNKNFLQFYSSGSNETHSVLFIWRNNHLGISLEGLSQFLSNPCLFEKDSPLGGQRKKGKKIRGWGKKHLEIIIVSDMVRQSQIQRNEKRTMLGKLLERTHKAD